MIIKANKKVKGTKKEGLSLGKKREWRRKAKGRKGAGRIIEENKNKEEAK